MIFRATIPMKGLHTPRSLLWFHGFVHGRILHSGGLDSETNTISSSFITGQIKRFRKACIARRERAKHRLKKSWKQADQLLIDLADLSSIPTTGESGAQARIRETVSVRRLHILKQLSEIYNKIVTEIEQAAGQIDATAEMLLSTFTSYGHGLLREPVSVKHLPELPREDVAAKILENHENTWNVLFSVMSLSEEVKK